MPRARRPRGLDGRGDLFRPGHIGRVPDPVWHPVPACRRTGRALRHGAVRGAGPHQPRSGRRGGRLQTPALRGRDHLHPVRGRDQRASCRPQRHDERAVPQRPCHQDPSRHQGPCRGRKDWRWQRLWLSRRPAARRARRADPWRTRDHRGTGRDRAPHLPRICRRKGAAAHRRRFEPRRHPQPHRQALERHHHQGQPHHQFRHPQLRALRRRDPLEPAEEAEKPRYGSLRLSGQSRKRMDTFGGSRASHRAAGAMGRRQGAAGRADRSVQDPDRGIARGHEAQPRPKWRPQRHPSPAHPAVRPVVLRLLRRLLCPSRAGPLRLHQSCAGQWLRQRPHRGPQGSGSACAGRPVRANDDAGDRRRGHASLCRGNQPAQSRPPKLGRSQPQGTGRHHESHCRDRARHRARRVSPRPVRPPDRA